MTAWLIPQNVLKLLQNNEFRVPNDASLHSQALFIATNRLLGSSKKDLNFLNSSKITVLNSSPEVSKYQFANDHSSSTPICYLM